MNAMARPIRHVILDRDGVLNVESGDHSYLRDWSQWAWCAGARAALAMFTRTGVRISVATNQSGIGRGVVRRAAVDAIHAHMLDEAARAGGTVDRVLVCPHAPDDGCGCRKPRPGLLLEAVRASGVPPAETLVVGDDLRDLQAAWAAGLHPVLVRTGKGCATEAALAPGHVEVFDDLHALAAALSSAAAPGVGETA